MTPDPEPVPEPARGAPRVASPGARAVDHPPRLPRGTVKGPIRGPMGVLASRVYGRVMAARNARYDRGRGVVRFDRPVVSVGNLSVGGTGKTPMVMRLACWLIEAGHRPCIAMRGYGARRDRADGAAGDSAAAHTSDEASAYARALPGVAIVARPDRVQGLIELFSREHDTDGPHSDCVLLDDGFQHRRIARDLDIVLIDATRDPFADALLPAGWLREPPASLARADLVVATHAEAAREGAVSRLDDAVRGVRGGHKGRGLDAIARHAWTDLDIDGPGGPRVEPAAWLHGRRVLAACAIGNPGPFLDAARRAAGAPLAAEFILRDHDPLVDATVARLLELAGRTRADTILVTDKDWSKLRGRPIAWPVPVVRPRLELAFDRGEAELRERVLGAFEAHARSQRDG